MKKIIIIITVAILSLSAENQEFVSKDFVKKELKNILKNVKIYKEKNDKEKSALRKEIDSLKRKIQREKQKEERRVKQIKEKLTKTKKELNKSKAEIRRTQKSKKYLKKKLYTIKHRLKRKHKITKHNVKKKNKIVKQSVKRKHKIAKQSVKKKNKIVKQSVKRKNSRIVENRIEPLLIKERIIEEEIIPVQNYLPYVKKLPWIEVVVQDNINIYQLALKYYGDENKYEEIYLANQHLIGENLEIYNGMSLKIPMNPQFKEQPMRINLD